MGKDWLILDIRDREEIEEEVDEIVNTISIVAQGEEIDPINIDDIREAKVYKFDSPELARSSTKLPEGAVGSFKLTVSNGNDDNRTIQTLFAYEPNSTWQRNWETDHWSPWDKVINTQDALKIVEDYGKLSKENKTRIEELEEKKADKDRVDQQIRDIVTEIVAGADESFDTLKEISDWIGSHSESAAEMNSRITQNEKDIDSLESRMTTAENDIDNLETTTEKHGKDIDSLKAADKEINDNINAFKTEVKNTYVTQTEYNAEVEELESSITTLNEEDDRLQGEIDALQAKDKSLDSDITGLREKDKEHDSEIEALQAKDSQHDNEISDLQDKDKEHDTAISELQKKDTEHETRMIEIEEKDATQDGQIKALEGKLTGTVGSDDQPVYLNEGTITATNKKFSQYLPLTGGTMTGAITSQTIAPSANSTYDLGSTTNKYKNVYATNFNGALKGNADTATKLSSAKNIALSGDATGSASFDGSAAVTIPTTLTSTGVTASTYGPPQNTTVAFGGTIAIPFFTVDAKGRLSAAGNRTITMMAAPTNITGNAATATTATKLGTATVGSNTKHFYLNNGSPTASTANVGDSDTPVYLTGGNITASTKKFSQYLPLAGGTMTGQIKIAKGGSWITTRDNAPVFNTFVQNSGSAAVPSVAMKSKSGVWAVSTLSNSDLLYFIYGSDTNYNAGTNTTNNWTLDSSGNFSGNAATATKLKTTKTILTNLGSTTAANFDGSVNVQPGITGTLPVAYGGTGATSAAAARENLGTLSAVKSGNFWGMGVPNGGTSNSDWVRTTSAGIIPYADGGPGNGHSQLGTSTWYFSHAYIDQIHGNADTATTATYLGKSTVGSTTTPMYLNTGVATVCTGRTVPGIKSLSTATHLSWGTNNSYVVDLTTLAYWNGRYNESNSNLSYCKNGEIVGTTGNQTIAGTKTFSSTINGSVSGNSGGLTNKTLNSTTINNTAGTFSFQGIGEPWSNTDWVGLQVGSDVDKFQICAQNNTLIFRQNDNDGTNTSWGSWVIFATQEWANSKFLLLSGGTMTGTINSQTIQPKTDKTYNLGSISYKFSNIYTHTHYSDDVVVYMNNSTSTCVHIKAANGAAEHTATLQAKTGIIALTSDLPSGTWTTVSTITDASSVSASDVKYKKYGDLVEISGQITVKTSTASVKICTLPAGYRPNRYRLFNLGRESGATVAGVLRIDTAGVVTLQGTGPTSFASGSTYYFNGMFLI